MRLNDGTDPYGAMARGKGTSKKDKAIGHKTPKLKSKQGFMPKNKPRGILKDNY